MAADRASTISQDLQSALVIPVVDYTFENVSVCSYGNCLKEIPTQHFAAADKGTRAQFSSVSYNRREIVENALQFRVG